MDTQVAGKLVLFWSSPFLANEFLFLWFVLQLSVLSTLYCLHYDTSLFSHEPCMHILTLTRINRYGATGVTVCCLLGGMNRFHMLLPFVLLLLVQSTCLIDLEIALHASLQGFYHMLAHQDDMNM